MKLCNRFLAGSVMLVIGYMTVSPGYAVQLPGNMLWDMVTTTQPNSRSSISFTIPDPVMLQCIEYVAVNFKNYTPGDQSYSTVSVLSFAHVNVNSDQAGKTYYFNQQSLYTRYHNGTQASILFMSANSNGTAESSNKSAVCASSENCSPNFAIALGDLTMTNFCF